MTALRRLDIAPKAAPQPAPLRPGDRALLDRLRAISRRGAARARIDPMRACDMLRAAPEVAAPVFADALMRTLAVHLGRRPRLYAPGATELSFDERWLISLLRALAQGDSRSADFLIRSRVPGAVRDSVRFLADGLASRLTALTSQPSHSGGEP